MTKENLQSYWQASLKAIEHLKKSEILNRDPIIRTSESKDIKLDTDYLISDFLIGFLESDTSIVVISEEKYRSTTNLELYWLIDPLDGSYNFSLGIKHYSVSIALMYKNSPLVGVVWDISNDNVFSAIKGYGAFKDGIKLETPLRQKKDDGVLMTGIPSYLKNKVDRDRYWDWLIKSETEYKKLRMIGCASLSIVGVCLGSASAYVEHKIAVWDVMGALCLANELGLCIKCDFSDSKFSVVEVTNLWENQ